MRETVNFGEDNLLATKLLLSLCVRKGELLGARWAEFDLDGETTAGAVWHLPASRTKTGETLDIPLAPAVVEWLRALHRLAAGSEYVFPKRRRDPRERVPHMGIDTLNVALNRVAHELPHFTLHDLRRTARTHLAALGVRREVAERCLGHKLRGVEGTYDRHDYFRERRAALESWAALLLSIERGDRKVAPLRPRRPAERQFGRRLKEGSAPSLLRALEVPVDPVQVEPLGIEHAADPSHHVLMLLVLSVREYLEKQRVTRRPTNIFWRAGVFAGQAYREAQIRHLRKRRQGLDHDPVPPAVTHVVAILELAPDAQLRRHGRDRDPALVPIPAGIPVVPDLLDPPVRRDRALADLELVCVRVRPPHDPLEVAMQAGEGPLIRNQNTPPDKRLYVQQFDSQGDRSWPWGRRQVESSDSTGA